MLKVTQKQRSNLPDLLGERKNQLGVCSESFMLNGIGFRETAGYWGNVGEAKERASSLWAKF